MRKGKVSKAGIIIPGILLLFGLAAFYTYRNWQQFTPKVEEVRSLHIAFEKDTALVIAGIQVQNRAPFPFTIDSIKYQISTRGVTLCWGSQLMQERLPALEDKELDFRLFLDLSRYQKQISLQKDQDSLHLDVQMQVFFDPPLFNQQVITLDRTLALAKPKGPALKIDSLIVKNFSPDSGYTFQLNLNTDLSDLPALQIENLEYEVRLSDSLLLGGKLDSTFLIKEGAKTIEVPVHLETSEMITLLFLKLGKQNIWPYEATASATVKANHPLFTNTEVSLEKNGLIDTRKIKSKTGAMPHVIQVQSLQLVSKPRNTYLQAELLVQNPTPLPLYLDSARYFVRHLGKTVAQGGLDYNQEFPAESNKPLKVKLAVNNAQYNRIMAQARGKTEIPIEAEVVLHYNLKGSKPQQISIKEKLAYPVTEAPGFKVIDVGIKQFSREQGAQLFVKMAVQNHSQNHLQLDDLQYRLLVDKNIEVTGRTQNQILIDTGTTELEIPVDLSAAGVNHITKGLIQGKEDWDYTLDGLASVSTQNKMVQHTEINLQTGGVFSINSKGSPDYMPEISKIDTVHYTVHTDTAWVNMYAAIYNTLPVPVNLTKMQVDVIHQQDTIALSEEKLRLVLTPNANSFAWHTLGINYDTWGEHVQHHQSEDSMLLKIPVRLYFELADLGPQQAALNLDTRIPTPVTPATELGKIKFRGFSFRHGIKLDALVTVHNANSAGLTISNIDYRVLLENGVDMCGKINRTYRFPIGKSEVQFPVSLSVWEAAKMLKRQFFGPPVTDYKINATATVSTGNPKMKHVYVVYENQYEARRKKSAP
ncbi:NDR1/HIN1-like protein [Adhaeribacter soli]|uniref:LEA type 2 family protein n=1 Tax=Adhaeribacter soli TaxID=2607655 RepID=A0A5N1J6B3_9BACT|nr:LEA type 2 family protein [Adhaeribacter soli]KAA9340727.1 LEA type 2 family protein [Adhaeribacter soli]